MAETFDVIVCGLGGMGSATACHLAARGAKVLGLDRFHPPHTHGSSHGKSRVIRQAYFENTAYVPLLLRAYELWEQLVRDTGQPVLNITGGLFVGSEESQVIVGSTASALKYDLPHEVLDAAEIRNRFPVMNPPDSFVGLYEAKAGYVNPDAAVAAHLSQAAGHGAVLGFDEPVEEVRFDTPGGGVWVRTSRGEYLAARLVVTTGPWAAKIFPGLKLPLRIERQVLYWFRPPGGVEPFMPDRFPIHFWKTDDGAEFYGVPYDAEVEGAVKIAFHTDSIPCDPDTVDRTVSEADITRIRSYLERYIPAMAGECLETVTCLYSQSPQGDFILGSHPANDSVVLGVGFSGHGFKFTPVIGEILADLATEGSTRLDISPFAASHWIET